MDPNTRLQDLIDISTLQALLDSLLVASRIPSAVIDLEGVVLAGAGWQEVCTNFHRVHPESLEDCIQSDIHIAQGLSSCEEFAQITCPRGLTDTASPLILEGRHLANIFTGQVFITEPDAELFRAQARRFGYDEAAYMEAFRRIPVITQARLRENLLLVSSITMMMAGQGLARLRDRRSQEALRDALEFNGQIIRSVREGVIVLGPDLRYRVWNAFMEEHSGVPAAAVLGRHPAELQPALAEVGILDRLQRVLAGEAVGELEFPFPDARTGRTGWFLDRSVPFRAADGSVIGVLATVQDITARKEAELALRDSYDHLAKIVSTAPGIVCSYRLRPDGTACFPFGGDRLAGMAGIPGARLDEDAAPFLSLCHPEDLDGLLGSVLDSAQDLSVWRQAWRMRLPDGRERWFEAHSVPEREPDGGVLWKGITTDITAARTAEVALRKSEASLKTAQRVAQVGSWTWDIRNDHLEWSDEMYRIFGIAREGFSGVLAEVVAGCIHPEDRPAVEASNLSVARDGVPVPLEYRIVRPDGGVRTVWAEAGELLQDGTGRPAVLTGIVQDITERRKAEARNAELQAQLLQSQKLESLGSLAGGVAHDINNVLGAIQAIASLHGQMGGGDARLRRDMDTITTACQRGGNLTRGLLTFARRELGERQAVDLNALVREEVALLARATLQKVELHLSLAEDLPLVKGDPSALSHALMNLCVNAVDAMARGGTLSLRTGVAADGAVLLEVADTGEGMAPEVLAKAMDPFFTTKPQGKGTGLGLAMVYGTVQAHGGRVELESEPGRGTRATLHFPALAPAPADPRPAPAPAAAAGRSLEVLLVDDDELIRGSVPPVLEYLGHHPTAAGGAEAIGLLAGGLRPDAVILDMNMPGLDGADTLVRLRELCPGVPVLLATGRVDPKVTDLVAGHPGVSLLSKPFEIEELGRRIQALV